MPKAIDISFPKDYVFKAHVQNKQNLKFKNFIFNNLKEFSYFPQVVAELGVGDGTLAEIIAKYLRPKILYLVDKSDFFLHFSSKRVDKVVTIKTMEAVKKEK
jgi:ubiquinone/menaquinone biosynthesis C-methylase UbiE